MRSISNGKCTLHETGRPGEFRLATYFELPELHASSEEQLQPIVQVMASKKMMVGDATIGPVDTRMCISFIISTEQSEMIKNALAVLDELQKRQHDA